MAATHQPPQHCEACLALIDPESLLPLPANNEMPNGANFCCRSCMEQSPFGSNRPERCRACGLHGQVYRRYGGKFPSCFSCAAHAYDKRYQGNVEAISANVWIDGAPLNPLYRDLHVATGHDTFTVDRLAPAATTHMAIGTTARGDKTFALCVKTHQVSPFFPTVEEGNVMDRMTLGEVMNEMQRYREAADDTMHASYLRNPSLEFHTLELHNVRFRFQYYVLWAPVVNGEPVSVSSRPCMTMMALTGEGGDPSFVAAVYVVVWPEGGSPPTMQPPSTSSVAQEVPLEVPVQAKPERNRTNGPRRRKGKKGKKPARQEVAVVEEEEVEEDEAAVVEEEEEEVAIVEEAAVQEPEEATVASATKGPIVGECGVCFEEDRDVYLMNCCGWLATGDPMRMCKTCYDAIERYTRKCPNCRAEEGYGLYGLPE